LLDSTCDTLDASMMETFAPEFAEYWLTGSRDAANANPASGRGDDAAAASQREALEALAERVAAARSIL
jgi:hypothetical protein